MPSPFPGMDPFLEHPVFFGGLHSSMIAYLCEFMQAAWTTERLRAANLLA
jgi:hypothetical protein